MPGSKYSDNSEIEPVADSEFDMILCWRWGVGGGGVKYYVKPTNVTHSYIHSNSNISPIMMEFWGSYP